MQVAQLRQVGINRVTAGGMRGGRKPDQFGIERRQALEHQVDVARLVERVYQRLHAGDCCPELLEDRVKLGRGMNVVVCLAAVQQEHAVLDDVQPELHIVTIDARTGDGGGGDHRFQTRYLLTRLADQPGHVIA